MTLAQFRDALMSHLTEDLDTDRDEGTPHAQRAKMLLDHIGAIAEAPATPLDREDLLDLGMIEQCVRRLGQRAQDKARQG